MPVIMVIRVVRVVSSMVIINFASGTVISIPLENSTDQGCRDSDCRSEQRNCGKHSQRFKCDTHASGSFVRLCPRTSQHPRIDGEGSAIVARFMLHPSIPQLHCGCRSMTSHLGGDRPSMRTIFGKAAPSSLRVHFATFEVVDPNDMRDGELGRCLRSISARIDSPTVAGQNSAVLAAASADLLGLDRAITDGEQHRNAAPEPSCRLTRRDHRE
jgi:hypothetical protein